MQWKKVIKNVYGYKQTKIKTKRYNFSLILIYQDVSKFANSKFYSFITPDQRVIDQELEQFGWGNQ